MTEIGVGTGRRAARRTGQIGVSNSLFSLGCALADFAVAASTSVLLDSLYHHGLREGFLPVAALIAGLFVAFQYAGGSYSLQVYPHRHSNLQRAFVGWCMAFFVVAWVGFLMKATEEFSRAVLTLTFVCGLAAVLVLRLTVLRLLERARQRGTLALRKAYLLYGGDADARERFVREAALHGVQIVGTSALAPERLPEGAAPAAEEACEEVKRAFRTRGFEEVYVLVSWASSAPVAELTRLLAQLPLPVFVFAEPPGRRLELGCLSGFELQRAPLSPAEMLLKRGTDVAVALAAIVLLAPLLALVSAAVYLESGRPVIFRQRRKGYGGRPFKIFKFRTMRACDDGKFVPQAVPGDPRVTPLGAVLRRASIDELPQLFNVLKGDMSIVGPRPHAVAHDEYYDPLIDSYALRHHVKPGLTGWAQVNGFRGETKDLSLMAERVKHDLWYINHWSMRLDATIIARTAWLMLFDDKAY